MKVLHSELEYTGGGIWCAWGELEDGKIFAGSDNMGFVIYNKTILDYIEEHKAEYLGDDTTVIDVCGINDEEYIHHYTDDYDSETFDIWTQVYEQHQDCADLVPLLTELNEMHRKGNEPTDTMFYINCDGDTMTAVKTFKEAVWLVEEYKKEDAADKIRHKYSIEETDYNEEIINAYQER